LRAQVSAEYEQLMKLEALRALLRRYEVDHPSEAACVRRMLRLAESSGSAERSHFAPGHFTSSAFVLSPSRSEVLLIHHRKLGIWVQPGGHVEPGDENALAAARREVREEVGLSELDPFGPTDAIFDLDIHAIPAHKAEPAHEHFDVRFAFVAKTHQFTRSEEVADARWVSLPETARITSDVSVLRAVEKLKAGL
jgi:8-oxo-dGTP pyrophosphatase MutT (NUDIX family)